MRCEDEVWRRIAVARRMASVANVRAAGRLAEDFEAHVTMTMGPRIVDGFQQVVSRVHRAIGENEDEILRLRRRIQNLEYEIEAEKARVRAEQERREREAEARRCAREWS